MRQRFDLIRASITDWFLARDTVLMELSLAFLSLINAGQVLTRDAYGNSLAPFLSSGVEWLRNVGPYWTGALTVYAAVAIAACILGQVHSNRPLYLFRAVTACFGAVLWAMMSVAIFTGEGHTIVALRYIMTAIWTVLTCMILFVKREYNV